nr:hypothetical protein [uncultured Roseateles sp.]
MNSFDLTRRIGLAERRNPVSAPDSAELTLGYEAAYPFLAGAPEQDDDEPVIPVHWQD